MLAKWGETKFLWARSCFSREFMHCVWAPFLHSPDCSYSVSAVEGEDEVGFAVKVQGEEVAVFGGGKVCWRREIF